MKKQQITAHEPAAALLDPDDVARDVAALSDALLEQRAERIAHNVLLRPDIQEALRQLLASRLYADEEEIIARSLKALQVAIAPVIAEVHSS
jgi:hypothetical protein